MKSEGALYRKTRPITVSHAPESFSQHTLQLASK